jgi:hypothetical protein
MSAFYTFLLFCVMAAVCFIAAAFIAFDIAGGLAVAGVCMAWAAWFIKKGMTDG